MPEARDRGDAGQSKDRSMTTRARRLVLALLAVVAVALAASIPLFAPASSSAQSAGERIRSMDVALTVEADGDLLVEETIEYDFGAASRHGIFRDIPVRFHYGDTYDRVYPLDDVRVTASEGTPADVHIEDVGGGLKRIRIGDADREITGRHTYVISYRVRGALNGFESHDELYWDAIGLEWPVPIDAVTARVVMPAAVTDVACFAGPEGSSLPCDSAEVDGEAVTFAQAGLGAFGGLTVVVAIPKGAVPEPQPILDERWSFRRAFSLNPVTIGGFLAVAGVALGAVGRVVWRRGRDRRYTGGAVDAVFGSTDGTEQRVGLFEDVTTPVEYLPPDALRPGQIGTLLDEVANPLDVTATIVDLAVRGYLRIEEVPKEGWFGKEDWRLLKLREPEDLLAYERTLHVALFEDGGEVLLSDLKDKFVSHLKEVQDDLYDDALKRGWFIRRPDQVRNFWVVVGIGILVVGIALTVALAVWTSFAIVSIPIAVAGLALLVFSGAMPHRTAAGTSTLRRARGFKRFIEEADRDQARFAEEQQIFSEYLPYAVVFGAVERWAKAFEGLDRATETSSWYVASRPFTAAAFASSMGDFSVTAAGTIASSPSSSGGSGFSGGSSGGGGGGGGGGSW